MLHKFYCHLPIRASKVQIKWRTLARMTFLIAPKRETVLYWKVYVHNILLACKVRATVISWSFKMLARIWHLLAPGNQASAYVAPWSVLHVIGQYVYIWMYITVICSLFHCGYMYVCSIHVCLFYTGTYTNNLFTHKIAIHLGFLVGATTSSCFVFVYS